MSAATATFDEAFALLLQLEGNIAGMLDQPFYDSWRRSQGLPPRPVVQATLAEAQEFIYDNYWRPLSCGVMPRAWALMVLCEEPNLPWTDAVKIIQNALAWDGYYTGAIDGESGAMTLQAMNQAAASSVLTAIHAFVGHYASSPLTQDAKGFRARLKNLLIAIQLAT